MLQLRLSAAVAAAILLTAPLSIALSPNAGRTLDAAAADGAPDDLARLLAIQMRNFDVARELLALDAHSPDAAFDAARIALRSHAFRFGVDLPAHVAATPEAAPSEGLRALAARHGVALTPAQAADLAVLDAHEAAPAIGRLVAAFLAYDAATTHAFGAADAARLASAWPPTPEQIVPLGVDLAPLLAARLALLDAVQEVRDALQDAPAASLATTACPAFAFDLGGGATTYASDCALILDVGGNDQYPNNAGGSSLTNGDTGSFCMLVGGTYAAAALVDLGGDDNYGVSTRGCGVTGGGYLGAGFLADLGGTDAYAGRTQAVNGGGFGFLLDDGGSDDYLGAEGGVNGGGSGILVDSAGDDFYSALSGATNGGALGNLVDLAGSDVYSAGGGSTNGGNGFLLDAGESRDRYLALSWTTNGGGSSGGVGFLLDAGGNDDYFAGYDATNGAGASGVGALIDLGGDDHYDGDNGYGLFGIGLLFDGAGYDYYRDAYLPCSGTGYDVTVVPKCDVGAQIDREVTYGFPDVKWRYNGDGTCTYYDDRDQDNAPDVDEALFTGPCV